MHCTVYIYNALPEHKNIPPDALPVLYRGSDTLYVKDGPLTFCTVPQCEAFRRLGQTRGGIPEPELCPAASDLYGWTRITTCLEHAVAVKKSSLFLLHMNRLDITVPKMTTLVSKIASLFCSAA